MKKVKVVVQIEGSVNGFIAKIEEFARIIEVETLEEEGGKKKF